MRVESIKTTGVVGVGQPDGQHELPFASSDTASTACYNTLVIFLMDESS